MVRVFIFVFFVLVLSRMSAQTALTDRNPILLPNGKAYRVTESWFDPNPPFLEFYRFGEKENLKLSGSVFILMQDSRKDMWLTDQEGSNDLIRFDGHEFKYFSFPGVDTVSLGKISHMVENADGNLWFSHEKGMSRYDPETETFKHFLMLPDSAQSVPDAFFEERPSGDPSRNAFFDPLTGIFTRAFSAEVVDASDANNHSNATFHWIFNKGWRDAHGDIWLNGVTPIGKGLLCVKPEEARSILYPMRGILVIDKTGNPDYDPWNTDLYADTVRNKIWVSGWRGGLRSFDLATKQWTQFARDYRGENSFVRVDLETTLFIHPATNGKLWLGTTHGLTLFDPETQRFQAWWENDTPGCVQPGSHNAINALSDREGRLWLAEGNFMVHDPKRFFFRHPRFDFPEGRLEDAAYDPVENRTWFLQESATDNSVCDILEVDETLDQITRRFSLRTTKGHYNVDNLVKRGNELYFTAENKFYSLELTKGKFTHIDIPVPEDLRGRIKSFSGLRDVQTDAFGALWITISHLNSGVPLIRYTPWDQRFDYVRTAPGALNIVLADALFIDSRGWIWIGCDHTDRKGVDCYDPKTGKALYFTENLESDHALTSNLVYEFAEDAKGRIWMTTERGVCYYDPSSGLINKIPGGNYNNFYIQIDKNGNVWLNGNEPALYKPTTGEWRTFNGENGLHRAHYKLYLRRDGAICWGPYYRLFPDSIPVMEQGPPVRITGFRLFDTEAAFEKNINFLSTIELTHDNNYFTLTWSAQNFSSSQKDQYAYQLVGIDTGWVMCGQRNTVSYPKIFHGSYLFRVKAANRDGVWGPEKTLKIIIRPAWYQTIWFKMLVFLLVFAAIYAAYRTRLRQVKLEAELRQKEAEFQQRLAEVQMSALRAQMNPHFIFNSLSSINRFIQFNEPDVASNYLTKFSRLIRLILDNSREDVVTLDQELEACRLYLELESLRFARQFLYTIDISPKIETDHIHIPPLLLQPYLENAIWHGLMQKESSDRKLSISISSQEQLLQMVIEDNGIGREKARALKSKSGTRHKSHGMNLTMERMDLYRRSVGLSLDVQICDVLDSNGEVNGTNVTILMQLPP